MDEQEEWFLNYLREGNGLLTMSSGYEYEIQIHKSKKEKKAIKKYKVMEGPLKVYEDKIKKVDKHERLAFLDFEVNGWCAQAGFNCLPISIGLKILGIHVVFVRPADTTNLLFS